MAKGVDTPMSSGVGLVMPCSRPGRGRGNGYADRVHWVRCRETEPEHADKEKLLLLQDTQGAFPVTWPKS